MGLIILIVPLIVYYAIIVPLVKKRLINKKITNSKLKMLAFIFLLVFPIADHIIGYGVYKILCYTKGGVKIYKTVIDEQEQRDYWIDTYNQHRPKYIVGDKYGIEGRNYLTKDLKYHKTVYINNCNTKRWKSYDCKKAEQYIQDNNVDIYYYIQDNDNLPRNKKYQDYLEEADIKVIRLINEKELTLEKAYFNKCSDEYNLLPTTDPNYKYSCTNADEIIKKYNLKNVIKVPRSKYRNYYSNSKKRMAIIPFILYRTYRKTIKNKTKELVGEWYSYTFKGGWYIQIFNPYHLSYSHCNDGWFKEKLLIPNPYKNIRGK